VPQGQADKVSRINPSSSDIKRNVRETHIQPRFLRAARIVLEAEPTADGASARARVTADEVMAVMAVTSERPDEEGWATAGSRDYRDARDCQGRLVCQGKGNVYGCRTLDMRDIVLQFGSSSGRVCPWLAG
jgi:hypothetical protein